jgi:hypothetical protein
MEHNELPTRAESEAQLQAELIRLVEDAVRDSNQGESHFNRIRELLDQLEQLRKQRNS